MSLLVGIKPLDAMNESSLPQASIAATGREMNNRVRAPGAHDTGGPSTLIAWLRKLIGAWIRISIPALDSCVFKGTKSPMRTQSPWIDES